MGGIVSELKTVEPFTHAYRLSECQGETGEHKYQFELEVGHFKMSLIAEWRYRAVPPGERQVNALVLL